MKVLLLNPGTHPELAHLAAALQRAGHEVDYFTASSLASRGLIQRCAKYLPKRIYRQVQRRRLPEGLSSEQVRTIGFPFEAFRMIAPGALSPTMLSVRNLYFKWRVNRMLAESWRGDVIVVQSTGGPGAYRFSRGHPNQLIVLNLPIPQHHWMARKLQDDAVRNPEWAQFSQHLRPRASTIRNLERELVSADYVIVASGASRTSLLEAGWAARRIITNPLGVDLTGSQQQLIEDLPREFTVLYAGQINQRKGIAQLVEATARIGAKLILVGQPQYGIEEMLRAFAHIEFIKPVDRKSLYALMRSANVFVLPSIVEGFGLVGLEAMANGVPIVASDATFAKDLISPGENGYVFSAGDAKALTSALLTLKNNPSHARRMGEAGRRLATAHTWDAYGDALAARLVLVQSNRLTRSDI